MRVWTWRRNLGNDQAELLCDGWPVTEAVGLQWVADACNAAEQRRQDDEGRWVWHRHHPQWEAHQHYGRHLAEELTDPSYAEMRRYGVYAGGKMVREVSVAAGEAVPLAQGESLGPHPSEVGEQSLAGR